MASGVRLLLSMCASVCTAFNVDTSFPLLKRGEDGSLFGLSVAIHKDLRTGMHLLLVGAPRARSEPQVPANRTGGVFSCPITASQLDCGRIALVDPDLKPEDLVEDMWLGVSIASQGPPGGRVLACGHRFVKLYGAFKLKHMIGRCYLRGNNLQYDDSAFHWQNPEQTCSHLGDVSGEVMCNMGMSAAITQTEVIVGSPGSYEWQGNVHVSWMNPDDQFDTRRISFTNVQQRNIYIGYSVTQARRLLSQDEETIITGAPKDTKQDARGSVLLAIKRGNRLLIQQTLRGEQMGSYFGNAVAAADLDSDGWCDLLVGAPFYFHRQKQEGGAVYVYMNLGGKFESRPSVVLRGPAGSAFGMAVIAAGDLDRDGFQDFAVGAPFQGKGRAMIWMGGASGISVEPSQVIQGISVSPEFKTFGFSLAAGLDVDGNGHPDLLVGSLDDAVALLRSRSVILLNQTLLVSPDVVDPNDCEFCIQVEMCFSFMYSSGKMSDKDNVTIYFTLTADVTRLKSRLRIQNNGESIISDHLTIGRNHCELLQVGLQNPIHDKVEPLVFQLNTSLSQKNPGKKKIIQDLRPVLTKTPRPIRRQIHIRKACGSDNLCHSNLRMMAQFMDENQRPFIRQNDSQILLYNSSISRLLLEVNVMNTPSHGRLAEDAHNTVLNVSIPPSLIYSGVRAKGIVTAVECSVDKDVLLCELGNPFRSNQQLQVLIIFQPSDMSLDTREIKSVLQLSTLSEQSDLPPVSVSILVKFSLQPSLTLVTSPGPAPFSGQVVGESAIKTTEDVGILLLFTLQVHISGRPKDHNVNLGVEFDWPWETSSGKWLLYPTAIHVTGTSEPRCHPPGNIINPLHLELSEKEKITGRRRSLKETKEEEEERRTSPDDLIKEEGTENTRPVRHLPAARKKSYTLDCDHGATCVRFMCPLVNMNNSAVLTVTARLWNSTMLEDFGDSRSVLVRGLATLRLHTDTSRSSVESHSTEIQVEVYPELGQLFDSGPPMWIVMLSVLAGILLFSIICLLLWKVGFFDQRRAWQTAAEHKGRILDKETWRHADADSFLIRDDTSSAPKHWVTWTEMR